MQVLIIDLMVKQLPVWLLCPPPVVEAKYDGEGAGGQQLPSVLVLLVLHVIEAVSRCQGKSVANLFENGGHPINQKVCCAAMIGDVLTNTLLHWLLM